MTHERLSVHSVTFYGAPLTDLQKYWTDLAVTRLSVLDSQLCQSRNSQNCCRTIPMASRPCTTCSPAAHWPTTPRTPAPRLTE